MEASGDRDETGTYRLTVTDVTPAPVPVVAAPVVVEPVPVVAAPVVAVVEPEKQITRPPFGVAGPPSVVSLLERGFPDAQVFPDSEDEPLVSQQQISEDDDYSAYILTTGRVAVGGSATGTIDSGA